MNTFKPVAGILLALSMGMAQAASGPLKAQHHFDIAAQPLATALRQFAHQAGLQISFTPALVEGKGAPKVQGEQSGEQALEQLLSGTGLEFVVNGSSVAVRRKNAADRRSELGAGDSMKLAMVPRSDETVASPPDTGELEVKDTRIEGLNNKGLLQGGENGALYHDVITREDIERSGVSSLEELFRTVPQTSTPRVGLQAPESLVNITGGVPVRYNTVGLRGFDAGQTVILVNGRALARTGGGAGGADLSRIPLSSIERIELMPYSGSAIYGAGAVGGAINIILRKEHIGRELTVYMGTTTDGGAAERRLNYLEGRSFADGRGRATASFTYNSRDPLVAADRDYLSEALKRYTPDNRTILDGAGKTPFEAFILPAFAGAPATIVVQNLPNAAVNDLGIPGAPGARWATVPAGTSPASSLTLTPASFTATARQASLGGRYGRSVLYEPLDSYSAYLQLDYDIRDDGWLSTYGELSAGYNRKDYSYPQGLVLTLSAADPLNPFRTAPGFTGRGVTVYLDPTEIADPGTLGESEYRRVLLGLKGRFTPKIEWSVDGTYDYSHGTNYSSNPPQDLTLLNSLTINGNPGPAAPAATRRDIYPILADHNQFPISAATAQQYFGYARYNSSWSRHTEGNARITGDLFPLPAGPLRASVFGKYQELRTYGGQIALGSAATSQLINNGPVLRNPSDTFSGRDIWQTAAEIAIPVIGKDFRPLPIESFEIQASTSRETHDMDSQNALVTGGDVSSKQESDSDVLAAKLQLTPDVAFRASYSEGFYPANVVSLTLPVNTLPFPFTITDPHRGNTTETLILAYTYGGNPDLEPEQAQSHNIGLMLTPRFLPGFSLNIDYWKIEKLNAIVSANILQIAGNLDLYSTRITREAPTADDLANGWLGRVSAVDVRPSNASLTKTEGVDVRLRYFLETKAAGSWAFNANATFTDDFILKVTAAADPLDTANGSGPLRRRGNASVTWSDGAWSATLGSRYVGHYSTNTTAPSPSFPGAIPYDGDRIPAFVRWDIQAGYEAPARPAAKGMAQWLSATQWSLGINNVLNDEPAFVTNGSSFYNQYDDPRQRFIYLSVRKGF